MRKLNLIIAAALSIGMLQACNNAKKDSTQTADSTNAAIDTAKKDTAKTDSSKTDTAASAAPASVAPANTPDNDDAKFAVTAADAGMTEIALSKAALSMSTNSKVLDFAKMMIKDHTKAAKKLMALCKAKNIVLPAAPGTDSQNAIDRVCKKNGSDFDKAYVNQMVADHKGAVALFTKEGKNAVDPDLKAFAINTLPTLQMHLDAIKAIKGGM